MRMLSFGIVFAAIPALDAHAAHDLHVLAADVPILVSPGGVADWTLRFENRGDSASPSGFAFDFFVDGFEAPLGYDFAAAQPGACSALTPLAGSASSFEFRLPQITPGSGIACTVHVSRSAASRSDVRIVVQQDEFDFTQGNSVSRYAGQPVVASLGAEKMPGLSVEGARAEQTVRILFHNPGPVDLQRVSFGYCIANEYDAPSVEFPGACVASGDPYGPCFLGSNTFEFPTPVRTGETASCLLRVAARWPLTGTGGNFLSLNSPSPNTDSGWTALIDNGARVDLTLRASDVAASRHAIPASRPWVLLAIAIGVLLAAVRKSILSAAKAGA